MEQSNVIIADDALRPMDGGKAVAICSIIVTDD